MEKCCEAIEKYGIGNQGIYRVSGTTSKVAALRAKLDRGEWFVFCACVVLRWGGAGDEWNVY